MKTKPYSGGRVIVLYVPIRKQRRMKINHTFRWRSPLASICVAVFTFRDCLASEASSCLRGIHLVWIWGVRSLGWPSRLCPWDAAPWDAESSGASAWRERGQLSLPSSSHSYSCPVAEPARPASSPWTRWGSDRWGVLGPLPGTLAAPSLRTSLDPSPHILSQLVSTRSSFC